MSFCYSGKFMYFFLFCCYLGSKFGVQISYFVIPICFLIKFFEAADLPGIENSQHCSSIESHIPFLL